MFGNWATRIPDMKESLNLSQADLGLALLGAPIGALCIMPLAGWLISRTGLGKSIVVSTTLLVFTAFLPAFAWGFWSLGFMLFLFGYTNSFMDIAMNSGAAKVEKDLQRPIMATCHGMWSLGAVVGSGLGSVMVGLKVPPTYHLVFTSALSLVVLLATTKRINTLKEVRQTGDKVFALPKGALLVLAIMAFCILLSEGAIADWSAVYMKEELNSNLFLTGIAYAGFSLLMALGRLTGDGLIPLFGKGRIVIAGGILSAVGLAIGLVFHSPWIAIVGLSITGLGYSCVVPILFISAANQPGYTPGTGIAAVTTLGYTGFLVGPPLIGFLAEAFNLTIGLSFVALCSFTVSILALTLKFR